MEKENGSCRTILIVPCMNILLSKKHTPLLGGQRLQGRPFTSLRLGWVGKAAAESVGAAGGVKGDFSFVYSFTFCIYVLVLQKKKSVFKCHQASTALSHTFTPWAARV